MTAPDEANQALLNRIEMLESQLRSVESSLNGAQRRGRNAWLASGLILFSAITLAANPQVQAQFGVTLASLNTRLTAVENKTSPLAYNSGTKLLTISGANVMIVDGSGATNSSSGLGNLQVGYNELRPIQANIRTGTHNVILGSENNYSSYGGFIGGATNTISAKYAFAAGKTNTASGDWSSVSGGTNNAATAPNSSVSGGGNNMASELYSSVSGGYANKANNQFASVSGGTQNLASGIHSSVSGGYQNTASGDFSSVSGGFTRSAPGTNNWAAGTFSSPD